MLQKFESVYKYIESTTPQFWVQVLHHEPVYKYILYSYGGMKQLYFLFANFWGYIILKKKKNHIWVNMVNDDIAREDI